MMELRSQCGCTFFILIECQVVLQTDGADLFFYKPVTKVPFSLFPPEVGISILFFTNP